MLFEERRRLFLSRLPADKTIDKWFETKDREVKRTLNANKNLKHVRWEYARLIKKYGTKSLKLRIVYVPDDLRKPIKFFTLESYERFVALRLYISTKTNLQNKGTFGIAWTGKGGRVKRNQKTNKVKFAVIIDRGSMG